MSLNALQQLNTTLSPFQGSGVDVARISLTEFKKITENFSGYLSHQFYDDSYHNQMDSLWLYMAFSLNVHHWAHKNNTVSGKEKLQAIAALDSIFLNKLDQFISHLNLQYDDFFNSFDRSFYQKLLMINNCLFGFRQMLSNKDFGTIFNKNVLNIAKKSSQIRKQSATSTSENITNQALTKGLQSAPGCFQPLKQTQQAYIDFETGLELDFPINSKITIETDGAHHYYQHDSHLGRHTLVHHMKSFALRESGWVRAPLPTDKADILQANAANIAKLLHFPQVAWFSQKYQECNMALNEIQEKIQTLSRLLSEASTDAKKEITQAIASLLSIEQNLRKKYLEVGHLKKLLKKYNDSTIQNKIAQCDKQVGFFLELKNCQNTINRFKDLRITFKAELEPLETVKAQLKNKILFVLKQIEEKENSIRTWSDRLATNKSLSEVKIKEYTDHVNFRTKEKENLEKHFKKLDEKLHEIDCSIYKISPEYRRLELVQDAVQERLAKLNVEMLAFFKDFLPLEAITQDLRDSRKAFDLTCHDLTNGLAAIAKREQEQQQRQRQWFEKENIYQDAYDIDMMEWKSAPAPQKDVNRHLLTSSQANSLYPKGKQRAKRLLNEAPEIQNDAKRPAERMIATFVVS